MKDKQVTPGEHIAFEEEKLDDLAVYPQLRDEHFNRSPLSERIHHLIEFVSKEDHDPKILEILRATNNFISATALDLITTRIEMNAKFNHSVYGNPYKEEWKKLLAVLNSPDIDSLPAKEYASVCKQYVKERMIAIQSINKNDPYYVLFQAHHFLGETSMPEPAPHFTSRK